MRFSSIRLAHAIHFPDQPQEIDQVYFDSEEWGLEVIDNGVIITRRLSPTRIWVPITQLLYGIVLPDPVPVNSQVKLVPPINKFPKGKSVK